MNHKKEKDKQKSTFVTIQITRESAKLARIAAIQEGIYLRDWISRAITQALKAQSGAKA